MHNTIVTLTTLDAYLEELTEEADNVRGRIVRIAAVEVTQNATHNQVHFRTGFISDTDGMLREFVTVAGDDFAPLNEGTQAAALLASRVTESCRELELKPRQGMFEVISGGGS